MHFINNTFQEYKEKNAIAVEVSIDSENDVDYRLALILRFTNVSGYDELVFYFSLIDKNNQFVKGKESIYNREEANKYLPKKLQGSISFFTKLKEMFKKLINMETPDIFFMETYEDFISERLLNPYRNLIPLILENGYLLEKEGISHDKKKYYWKFVKKTNQQIKEDKEFEYFINNFKKDDEYWEKFNKESRIIIEKMYGNKKII